MPFPFGASPFHTKGVIYSGWLQHIAETVPGGVAAVLAQIPREKQAFYGQTFLATAWYDVLPTITLGIAAGRATGVSHASFLAGHARWQTQRDSVGLNRIILSAGSIENVGLRLGATFGRYFDFADVTSTSPRRGVVVSKVRGLPRFLFDWYRLCMSPSGITILTMAGARDVQSEYSPLESDGVKAGVRLVRFDIERRWSE